MDLLPRWILQSIVSAPEWELILVFPPATLMQLYLSFKKLCGVCTYLAMTSPPLRLSRIHSHSAGPDPRQRPGPAVLPEKSRGTNPSFVCSRTRRAWVCVPSLANRWKESGGSFFPGGRLQQGDSCREGGPRWPLPALHSCLCSVCPQTCFCRAPPIILCP